MTTITARSRAPLFTLNDTSGVAQTLAGYLKKGPVALAFFKVSCPVCQFAFPFLERIHVAYDSSRVTVLGVSQDDRRASIDFMRDYGTSFPILIDDKGYPVSNAYGLTNVPTVLLIAPDGSVQVSSMGFNKADFEEVSRQFAAATKQSPAPVFLPGEVIPDYKPG